MDRVLTFLREVRVEMAKVSWPTRKQTTQYTLVVVGMSLVLAVFLGAIDYLLQLGLNTLIQ